MLGFLMTEPGILQQNSQPIAPSGQIAASGPIAGRDAHGRFTGGNRAAMTHGMRSHQAAGGALLPPGAPTLAERADAIRADLGDELSAIKGSLLGRHVMLAVLAEHLEGHLLGLGVLTAKGRTRAALNAYLSVLDRLTRSAQILGLERKPKRVPNVLEYLEARARETRAGASE
jgi:hypothetical protein